MKLLLLLLALFIVLVVLPTIIEMYDVNIEFVDDGRVILWYIMPYGKRKDEVQSKILIKRRER